MLVAKVPERPNKNYFPQEDFKIDLQSGTCTCPAGQEEQLASTRRKHYFSRLALGSRVKID